MIDVTAVLGGDVELAHKLRDGVKEYFPATSTFEQMQQYMAEYKSMGKSLTGGQSEKLVWITLCKAAVCYLLEAASGTGKTLLIC